MDLSEDEHIAFVDAVSYILSEINIDFNKHDIEKQAIDEGYKLHFDRISDSDIDIGVWMMEENESKQICLFIIHEWIDTSVHPTISTPHIMIGIDDDIHMLDNFINIIKHYVANKISAYYDLVDFDEVCLCHHHKHKHIAYIEEWIRHKFNRMKSS